MTKEEALVLIEKKRDVLKKKRDQLICHFHSEDRYKQQELSALDKEIECLSWAYDLVKQIEIPEPRAPYRSIKILLP